MQLQNAHIRHAARLSFVLLGVAVAMWGALIPYVKVNLGVDEGVLGLLLLCVGFGALFSMPFAGALTTHFGCRRMLQVALPLNFIFIILVSLANNIWLCAVGLLALGMVSGITDIAINIQAVIIEKEYQNEQKGRKGLMSDMHGMYSMGNILGALGMISLLSLELSPLLSVVIFTGVSFAIIFCYCSPHFLPYASKSQEGARFALPRGLLLFIGVLCFLLYMNEGIVLDWAAIFLITERQIDPAQASMAFVFFSISMTLGRLNGDKLVQRFGVKKVLLYGVLLAAVGEATIIFGDTAWSSLVGFACVGLGSANAIPQLFSLSAKQKEIPIHTAISTVTILGFIGLLLGPAIMGFVAEAFGLSAIFGIMAVVLIGVGSVVPWLFRSRAV